MSDFRREMAVGVKMLHGAGRVVQGQLGTVETQCIASLPREGG